VQLVVLGQDVLLCEGVEAMDKADRSETYSQNATLCWTLVLTASAHHEHPTNRG
jgi:hypothetical protein